MLEIWIEIKQNTEKIRVKEITLREVAALQQGTLPKINVFHKYFSRMLSTF